MCIEVKHPSYSESSATIVVNLCDHLIPICTLNAPECQRATGRALPGYIPCYRYGEECFISWHTLSKVQVNSKAFITHP